MPGRHHSAQELEFFKEAYKKDERHAYGGHTLDLIDHTLAKRYGNTNAEEFRREFKRGIDEVENALTAQKLAMSDAFVQMEYDRVNARKMDPGARGTDATAASTTPTHTRAPGGNAANSLAGIAAKRRAQEASQRHDALQRGLAVLNDELSRLDPDGSRAQARFDAKHGSSGDQTANRENRSRRRRRRGDMDNEAATRMKMRSDLEKRAQQITHAEAHRIHIGNQYTTMQGRDFARPDLVDIMLEPNFNANNFKNARNTRFAAARIVAIDLFGEKRF
ncbi:Hypothetical Protein FCC1311_029992 [Hondaea fermentalgiana]|uniref:Uncharacterized protein n=1 Tax=Hondaea fermentalgiana TaxID=2315210 RepID=A0A2R5G6U1_9STRA|nr:Hypothetical Protein FCC1311_029992 [Hondaea fermentalgiana]|eukprot:GBG26777.1 Hypothetical Protein FCC1311_029992 [Hondaea fermentalgiana]